MVIRAVFFDVDDTLVDFAAASRPALEHVLGAKVDFEQWQNLPHYDRFVSGELDFDAMRALRMADFLATLGRHDEDPVGLEAARMAYLAASYTLFGDVIGCLDWLAAAGLPIGVITNNDGGLQRDKLRRLGIADRFAVLAISGELGFGKPDPRIFHYACEQLRIRPDEAIHVGDRLDVDAQAAVASGMSGIWLNRSGKQAALPAGAREIADLRALRATLGPAIGAAATRILD